MTTLGDSAACPWCADTGAVAGDGCVACANGGRTLSQLWPETFVMRERQAVRVEARELRTAMDTDDSLSVYRRGYLSFAERIERARIDTLPAAGESCNRLMGLCDQSCTQLLPPTNPGSAATWWSASTSCKHCMLTDGTVLDEIEQTGHSRCPGSVLQVHQFVGAVAPSVGRRLRIAKVQATARQAARAAKLKRFARAT